MVQCESCHVRPYRSASRVMSCRALKIQPVAEEIVFLGEVDLCSVTLVVYRDYGSASHVESCHIGLSETARS